MIDYQMFKVAADWIGKLNAVSKRVGLKTLDHSPVLKHLGIAPKPEFEGLGSRIGQMLREGKHGVQKIDWGK